MLATWTFGGKSAAIKQRQDSRLPAYDCSYNCSYDLCANPITVDCDGNRQSISGNHPCVVEVLVRIVPGHTLHCPRRSPNQPHIFPSAYREANVILGTVLCSRNE